MRARQKELAEIISVIGGNKEAPPPPDSPVLGLPLRLRQLPARILACVSAMQRCVAATLAAFSLRFGVTRGAVVLLIRFLMEERASFFLWRRDKIKHFQCSHNFCICDLKLTGSHCKLSFSDVARLKKEHSRCVSAAAKLKTAAEIVHQFDRTADDPIAITASVSFTLKLPEKP